LLGHLGEDLGGRLLRNGLRLRNGRFLSRCLGCSRLLFGSQQRLGLGQEGRSGAASLLFLRSTLHGLARLFGVALGLRRSLGLAPNVDAPARQLGRQPCVLSFLADGQRERTVRHDHLGLLGLAIEDDAHYPGRAQGTGDERLLVVRPGHDVDLFAVQLVHDVLYAHATHPDTGAHRIHARLQRSNRHLGPRSRLAGDGLDLHGAVIDLGDLQLEQAAQKPLVAARGNDLRPAARALHFRQVDPQTLVEAIVLARNLLAPRQQSLRLAEADGHTPGTRVNTAHHAVGQFSHTVGKLKVDGVALRLADALHDHLLGRLRGDAAKVPRLDLRLEDVPQPHCRVLLLCISQRDLRVRVLHLGHDDAVHKDARLTGLAIDAYPDVLVRSVVLLVGGDQRSLDRLDDHFR